MTGKHRQANYQRRLVARAERAEAALGAVRRSVERATASINVEGPAYAAGVLGHALEQIDEALKKRQ